jgi:hypothetical protein
MAKVQADKTWRVLTGDAADRVANLIKLHHGNLKDCAVLLVGKPKCGKKNGRVNLASSSMATPLMRAALAQHGEECDYVIAVGMDLWPQMPDRLRDRVLDKALCYFGGKDPERDDALTMRCPDVAGEFVEIVSRYGLPENDPYLQAFVKTAAKQMKIDFSGPPKE